MNTRLPLLLLTLGLLAGSTLLASAQNVPFSADKIPNKEALKTAQRALKTGEESYAAEEPDYAAALTQFLEAQKVNPNNGALNMRLGDCYAHLGQRAKALPYLEKATELETGPTAPRAHYLLARTYQLQARWADALKHYDQARPMGVITKKAIIADYTAADVARRMAECQAGNHLMKKPVRVFIDTLGATVNSAFDDYNPVVTADESVLLFTSRRAAGKGAAKASQADDIYQSRWDGDHWRTATHAGPALNSSAADVVVAVSPDGQYLLLHADDNDNDLSESHLTNDGWSKPRSLGSHINSKGRETSATFSPDGRYVYFVSDQGGGQGGGDIYRAELDSKTPAQNLGPTINTPYGEEGVFMQPDGKTLYFSSQGHGTMGGYDIFKSVYENGKWSEPENLGWPVNSPDDDVFFTTSASGRYGYFASNRPGGLGGRDIYRITFLGAEKQALVTQDERLMLAQAHPVRLPTPPLQVPIKTAELTLLRGTIVDAARKPVQAKLEVVNNATGQVVSTVQSTPAGKYLLSLPSGLNYGVVVHYDDLLFYSENVNLPPGTNYAVATRDIKLQKPEPGANVVLNNVFFEPGKAVLRTDSKPELERLIKLLQDRSRLKLQLCGHTDNSGTDEANLELSKQRAEAIKSYLTTHEIKPERLTCMGYGSSIPIASNTTPEGRRQNQRVEFKVLPK